jgi:RimJ/RimL family protein N-acetyltransferase
MLKIAFLIDHAEVIPTLAQWFRLEWSDYYAKRTLVDIEQDFRSDLNRDKLPIRLIAFQDDVPVGTIVLRERVSETHLQYQPGLGGLYVAISHRGQGIGTELVQAGMATADELGIQTLYATTHVAGGILKRLGWKQLGSVLHDEEQIALYQCTLNDTLDSANTTRQTNE